MPIFRVDQPSRAGGQSKPSRSGTRAHECIAGSTSQTVGCLQRPALRSSQACLRSANSSPARSAWLHHGSAMIAFSFRSPRRPGAGPGSHGTSRPSRRYRSMTAPCSGWRVSAAHRSSTLPPAPQTKQCHRPRPRCAANARRCGARDRCTGHGPRTWSRQRRAGTKPISSRTSARRTCSRALRKSIPGLAGPRVAQRSGTRSHAAAAALPEAPLVEGLALA